MNRKRHYRQLVLFVFVLIVPSVLVALLGRQILMLDSEYQKSARDKIAEEVRKRERAEIAKLVLEELDTLRLQAISRDTPSDPAVKFIGWMDERKLVLPWERDPNARKFTDTINEKSFAEKDKEAERSEPDRAEFIYGELVRTAGGNYWQRAHARFKQAGIQRGSGRLVEASEAYKDLLGLPSNYVDEDGYSFASKAADLLVSLKMADAEVVKRVELDLESPAALTLAQTYRWQHIMEALQSVENAPMLLKRLSARVAYLEQAEKDFDHDREFEEIRRKFSSGPEQFWRPSGSGLLISMMPEGASLRQFVIAVRRDLVFERVLAARSAFGPPSQIAFGGDSGDALDEQRLPGFKITFQPGNPIPDLPDRKLQPWLYAALLVVVALNLLGGYLLWRDTRREMRLAELRSQFVSSVSHELKTPLTSIRMFAEILQMGTSTDANTNAECLDTIVNESERLTRLLNNVLDFSRIEHGERTYRMEPTRLDEVVIAAARTMQYPLAEQGFDLRMKVDDAIPPVEADGDAVKQAVINLVTNAMKYSGSSRVIELRLFFQNGDAVIQVSDRGIGIPAGEQGRIFERFYRAHVPENRAISGTGLGLALVAHIAEAHGGSVQVESSSGTGSTFSIRIPVQGISQAGKAAGAAA